MEQLLLPDYILKTTREKFGREIQQSEPYFAIYQISDRCNLSCKHCGQDSYCRGSTLKSNEKELTTVEVKALLRNVAMAGTKSFSFVGGEPTLREDLIDLIGYASRLEMGVAIVTNGVTLNEEYARRLKQAGITQVKITFEGSNAQTHDACRGKGSFDKALRAIQNCIKEGVSVAFVAIISKLNYGELEEMIKLAVELKASIEVNEFLMEGKDKKRLDLSLTKNQRREMQRHMLRGQSIFGKETIRFDDYYIVAENDEAVRIWSDPHKRGFSVGSPWGIFGYGIRPNGTIAPDPSMPLEVGDLKKQSLGQVWKDSDVLNALRSRGALKGKCGKCEYRFICGGNRGRTQIFTGDLMGEDPFCWYEPPKYDIC